MRRSPVGPHEQQTRISARLLASLLFLATLGGCAFVRGTAGDEFGEKAITALESINNGVTTRAEVTAKLGAPDEIVAAAGREIYHYRRYEGKFGLILFFSRLNVTSDNLYVLFDREGIVEEVVFGKRTDRLKFQVWPFGDE